MRNVLPFAFSFLFATSICGAGDVLVGQSSLKRQHSLDLSQQRPFHVDLAKLIKRLSKNNEQPTEYDHVLKYIDTKAGCLTLEDGSHWRILMTENFYPSVWKKGIRLKVCYSDPGFFYGTAHIKNIGPEVSEGEITAYFEKWVFDEGKEEISKVCIDESDPEFGRKIVISSGAVFVSPEENIIFKNDWKEGDSLFVYNNEIAGTYNLYNFRKQTLLGPWLTRDIEETEKSTFDLTSILSLNDRLNEKIVSQKYATKVVSNTLINYSAGLKDPNLPIGVFLFLGPTGVGKTELAKVLSQELSNNHFQFVRFDMSQFSVEYSITQLFGPTAGYVGHEEGGQLTEALKRNPYAVVLLDEIEKAHPSIRKSFLSLFDDGYFIDAKNEMVDCRNVIFIMTSNLCSSKIINYSARRMDPEDILEMVEGELTHALSPELYNRTEPLVFSPLSIQSMKPIVDIMLDKVRANVKTARDIELTIDESVHAYLIEHGYSSSLGARPLRKLIKNTVVNAISRAILMDNIPKGSSMRLSYNGKKETWDIEWEKPVT
jgi:DNA polymerase III delta prime subunit